MNVFESEGSEGRGRDTRNQEEKRSNKTQAGRYSQRQSALLGISARDAFRGSDHTRFAPDIMHLKFDTRHLSLHLMLELSALPFNPNIKAHFSSH